MLQFFFEKQPAVNPGDHAAGIAFLDHSSRLVSRRPKERCAKGSGGNGSKTAIADNRHNALM
jgi:hypothetical protein